MTGPTLATDEHLVHEHDGELVVVDDVRGRLVGDQPFSVLTPVSLVSRGEGNRNY